MQVSVIMPTYNGERFLKDAIDSVLAQTHQDFELVVVDDGSTDGTPEILARYAAQDRRIVVMRQDREGVSAASNLGLRTAKNALVARIDSDDRMLPHRLERQIQYMRENPTVTVASSYYYLIDVRGRRIGRSGFGHGDGNEGADDGNLLNRVWISNGTVMMKKKAILDLGGYGEECIHGDEDRDLWGRVLTCGGIIQCQPEYLYEYRFHAGSTTSVNAMRNLNAQRFTEMNIVRRLGGEANLTREEFDRLMRARPLHRRLHDRRILLSFAFYNQATRYYGERNLPLFFFHSGVAMALRPIAILSRVARRLKRK